MVSCAGALVFGGDASELHVRVKQALAENPSVVLDLGKVTHVDSAGLGTLFAIYSSSISASKKLVIAVASQHIRRLLEVSRLASLVHVFDSVELAITGLSGRAG